MKLIFIMMTGDFSERPAFSGRDDLSGGSLAVYLKHPNGRMHGYCQAPKYFPARLTPGMKDAAGASSMLSQTHGGIMPHSSRVLHCRMRCNIATRRAHEGCGQPNFLYLAFAEHNTIGASIIEALLKIFS